MQKLSISSPMSLKELQLLKATRSFYTFISRSSDFLFIDLFDLDLSRLLRQSCTDSDFGESVKIINPQYMIRMILMRILIIKRKP